MSLFCIPKLKTNNKSKEMKEKIVQLGLLVLVLVMVPVSKLQAQPNYPMTPEKAQLIYTDLENFATTFDELKTASDTLATLQSMYLDKASPGLKEYITRHQLTAELLKTAIRKNPEKYERIPTFIAGLKTYKADFIKAMIAYGKVVPDVMYAPTYLLVGANRGIAQASLQGQLVTVTRMLDNLDKLTTVIIHELSHFQQAKEMGGQKYVALYSQTDNMLDLCLREGGAEFITYLALNKITQEKSLKYLIENETKLKPKFLSDLKEQDQQFWLWASLEQKEYPILLGYAMGFQICKAYYDGAEDKMIALKQILTMPDPDVFLEQSNYLSE